MRSHASKLLRPWSSVLPLLALGACSREPAAELLEVNRVAATEVQFGDALQLLGDGFALGKPVLVHFRGQVYRAGVAARDVDIALTARAESQHELRVPLPRETETQFSGEQATGAHVTFRGDLQVAIAANEPGAPPVIGTLHGSALELYPALETRASTDQRSGLGQRALHFFGLQVTVAREGGLSVRAVAPASRAEAAGVQAGDRIVRAGGLNVLEPSDLVPELARSLQLGLYRQAVPHSLLLDTDGFHGAPPRSLAAAALTIGTAALGLLLWASPLARLLATLLPHWLERLRARYFSSRSSATGGQRWGRLLARIPAGGTLGSLAWLGVGGALLAPALRKSPIDLGVGLLVLAFGAATLLIAASLIEGGRRGLNWSLRQGLRAALQQFLVLLPAGVALLEVCIEQGVDADEWVRVQGALPWQWNAFTNPGLGLSCIAMLLTALPERSAAHGRGAAAHAASGAGSASSLLGAIYAGSLCALATLVFLGGGAGLGDPAALDVGSSRIASSLIAWAKYACVCGGLAAVRALLQRLTLAQWVPLARRLLPVSLGAVLLGQAWPALAAHSEFWAWLLAGFGPLALALLGLLLPAAAWGLHDWLRKPERYIGLSPWL